MKSDKYFTPDIEDIRVGYECEVLSSYGWQPGFWPGVLMEDTLTGFDAQDNGHIVATKNLIAMNSIRVPYLTKEQIEAEGWEIYEKDSTKRHETELLWGSIGFTKNNYFLRWNFADMSISIILVDPSKVEGLLFNTLPEHFKCTCSCKDINTFRYICKLLNI